MWDCSDDCIRTICNKLGLIKRNISQVIVGVWSLVILAGCAYSIFTTRQVSMPISVIFSAVLTNFTAHKIAKTMNGSAPIDNNETNLDTSGDK